MTYRWKPATTTLVGIIYECPERNFDGRAIPDILVNRFKKKGFIECQTLELMKFNQRIEDSHQEIVLMSDKTVQELIDKIRGEIPTIFRVCESIAMLDMIAAFGRLATAGGGLCEAGNRRLHCGQGRPTSCQGESR